MSQQQQSGLADGIGELRRDLAAMADKVYSRVESAMAAWMGGDLDLAESLRHADDEIDALDVSIEERCTRLLGQHQLRGEDLRCVVGALRLITQLERVADLARSVGKRVMRNQDSPAVTLPGDAKEMADLVRTMAEQMQQAIAREDAGLARSVVRTDPDVDALNKRLYVWTIEHLKASPEQTELLLDVLMLARTLERIGDCCANAAEDVIYIVSGEIVRHTRL